MKLWEPDDAALNPFIAWWPPFGFMLDRSSWDALNVSYTYRATEMRLERVAGLEKGREGGEESRDKTRDKVKI